MSSPVGAPWGNHRAWFALPGTGVWFTGLNAEQLGALEDNYPAYVESGHPHLDRNEHDLECRVCRLAGAPALAVGALTRDGQYAPRAIARPNGIDVTGVNFEARVPLYPSREPGWLAVVQATDLARTSVVENYLRFFAAHQALRLGGVVLHSAGLVVGGRAHLFAGRSGAGKTTLTRKGHQAGAAVLSDDVNLVLPGGGGYEAHAVPFTGEFGRTIAHTGGPAAYPIAGLVLLERGELLGVEPIRPSAAVARLLVASPFVNSQAAVSEPLLDVLTALVSRLPVIALRCRRDDDFEQIMTAVNNGFAHERAD